MIKVLMVVGVVISIILVVPLFLSPKFTMSRSIVISAPVTLIFEKLINLNEYVKWNPFPEGDPTNRADVSGLGIGSTLVWKGDKTGEGKMTIVSVEPEQKITVKMEFYKPMTGEGSVQWITNAKPDSKTELIWTFEQDFTYFNRYFGLVMESMMGKHFEKGLLNFKTLVEASALGTLTQ